MFLQLIAKGYRMDCPIPGCRGDTKVTYTNSGPKMVMRRRACLTCGARFVTKEKVLRITTKGGQDGEDQTAKSE